MCRHGCWVHHFRIGDIRGEAAPAIQRNLWDKVLTDGHASFGEGTTVVSLSALGTAMQQPVWRPGWARSRRCRLQPVAQEVDVAVLFADVRGSTALGKRSARGRLRRVAKRSSKTMRATGLQTFVTSFDAVLARRLTAAGQPDQAHARLAAALRLAEDTGMHFYATELLRLRAHTPAPTQPTAIPTSPPPSISPAAKAPPSSSCAPP